VSDDIATVGKLKALLERVQYNAELLAKQRALGAQSMVTSVAPSSSASMPAPPSDSRYTPPPVPPPPVASLSSPPGVNGAPSGSPTASVMQEAEELDDAAMITIPPSAPPPADSEPPQLEADFQASQTDEQDVEADFSQSIPPPIEDIEAPPISTEQERGDEEEEDGLGASLGFSSGVSDEADEESDESSAPRTPPPESGPQVSIPPKESERPSEPGPAMEQLGGTIDFDDEEEDDERHSRELELASSPTSASAAEEDFEQPLPPARYPAAYHEGLSPPDTAKQDLEAHDRAEAERAERLSTAPPPPQPMLREPEQPRSIADEPTDVVGRPAISAATAAAVYESAKPSGSGLSFLDRLDASLALGINNDSD